MNYLNRFLTFSLTALAVALGVTSCEKDGLEGDYSSQVRVLQEQQSVNFAESISVGSPKGENNLTGKNASEFTHVYANSQILSISDASGLVWQGTYSPGNIAGLTPAQGYDELLLADGSYTASSVSEGDSQDAVLGFLPYTSSASFSIPSSSDVTLAVSHSRGFAIVNVEDALEGNRVTGARAGGSDLLGPDAEGDYFGYILPEDNKLFEADYDLDGTSTTISGNLTIAAGLAYTIDLSLEANTPAVAGSSTTTSTQSSTEASESLDVNSDGDQLDFIEREVVSVQATLDGVADGAPVVTNGAWSVSSDVNQVVSASVESSTESATTLDINSDGDLFDDISRTVTLTQTVIDGANQGEPNRAEGAWEVSLNRDSQSFGESDSTAGDGVGTTIPTAPDAADTLSAWSYNNGLNDAAWDAREFNFGVAGTASFVETRTRTIVINGEEDATPPAGALSESESITNLDYVAPASYDARIYSAWGEWTDVAGADVTPVVVESISTTTLATAGADVATVTATTVITEGSSTIPAHDEQRTRTITNLLTGNFDPAIAAEALVETRSVEAAVTITVQASTSTAQVPNPDYVPAVAYDVRSYSDWAPAFVAQTANFEQTRSVTNAGGNFDPAIVEEALSRQVELTVTGGGDQDEASTEAIQNLDVNSDGDLLDTITRHVDFSTVYTANFGLGSHTVDGNDGTWTIVQNNDPQVTYDVREYSAYGAWTGTAPAAVTEYGTWAEWSGSALPATIESGSPVVTNNGPQPSDVEFLVQTTTTPQFSVVAAYDQVRTRTAVSVVAAYQETRTRTVLNAGGNFDPAIAEESLVETRDVAEVRTDLPLDSETRTIAEVRTAIADLVATDNIPNPDYQAPAAGVTGTITTTPGLFGGFSYNITGLSNGGADVADDFLYDTEADAIAAAQAYLAGLSS